MEVKFGRGIAASVAALCQRLTLAVADHVIATNASYERVARETGRKQARQVTVVRNAPPSAWTRLPIRCREGVLEQVHVAYLGAISSQDGVEALAPVLADSAASRRRSTCA